MYARPRVRAVLHEQSHNIWALVHHGVVDRAMLVTV